MEKNKKIVDMIISMISVHTDEEKKEILSLIKDALEKNEVLTSTSCEMLIKKYRLDKLSKLNTPVIKEIKETETKVVFDVNVKSDIVMSNNKIFITDDPIYFRWDLPSWMPHNAYGKKLKDGTTFYHAYYKDVYPPKNTLEGRKRRFLFSLVLSNGNPTWKNIDDFEHFLEAYSNASTIEDVKEIICHKYCKRCTKKNKNKCTSDIGADAMTLAVNGYKI